MEYKKIDLNSYNIHMMKTDKFKTVEIRVVFYDEFEKKDITYRNFLFDMLTTSTLKYNTKRDLNIACQDLYSLYLNSATFRLGNYLISKVGISFLNPKYTEEGMMEKSIALLNDVLFMPNATENKFDTATFKRIKLDLEAEINTIKEEPRLYANIRLLENIDEKMPYNYRGYCYAEDLNLVTEKNLYEYYQKILKACKINVYVVGDFSFERMEKLLRKNLLFDTIKHDKKSIYVEHKKYRIRAKKIIEESNFNQSKLSIACKIKESSTFELKYVNIIYNMLLGGISDSLLMRNIREKHSIAYYINSVLNKADSLIIINSGINSSNFNKTVKLIRETLKQINNGDFSDEIILACKTEYISSLETASVTPNGIIDIKISTNLLESDDVETRKKEVMKVTKKDIVDFSKKVLMDTVYLLKGE